MKKIRKKVLSHLQSIFSHLLKIEISPGYAYSINQVYNVAIKSFWFSIFSISNRSFSMILLCAVQAKNQQSQPGLESISDN